jgi:hypothetical protein
MNLLLLQMVNKVQTIEGYPVTSILKKWEAYRLRSA